MRFRDHYFKRESTLSDSDTTIIDINVKDPISAFRIEYEATNGATSCLDHELHDDISKIELVDGSDVIASLAMEEWRGLNFAETGRLPHAVFSEAAGGKQEESCLIHFGRFMDDPAFFLDPAQFRNLQLRLTHALTISATVGFATGTGKITVMGRIIEEGAEAQQGYMAAKEKFNWASATSGDETIDLPVDHPYRIIMVKALKTLLRPDEVLSKIKLSIDADKYVAFDKFMEDIMDENESRLGEVLQQKVIFSADDGTALLDIYDIRHATIHTLVDEQLPTVEALDAEQVSVGLLEYSTPETQTLQATAKNLNLRASGVAPHACLAHWFGDPDLPEQWLDAPSFGDIKLIATQVAVGACAVVLQQVRTAA